MGVTLLRAEHYEQLLDLVRANEARFRAGALAQLPTSLGQCASWVGGQLSTLDSPRGPKLLFGIADETGRLCGFVGVESVSQFHGAGVWYGVAASHEGRGLVKTAVLQSMLAYSDVVTTHGLRPPPRWVLHALSSNGPSLALAKSLGFLPEPMLDYTRRTSPCGSHKFTGHLLQCSSAELRARVHARLMTARALTVQRDNRAAAPARSRAARA